MTREEAVLVTEVALDKALSKHPPMHSPHEGYAVILEEMEELWAEIKTQTIDPQKMRKEAAHLTAMGLRFLMDVCA